MTGRLAGPGVVMFITLPHLVHRPITSSLYTPDTHNPVHRLPIDYTGTQADMHPQPLAESRSASCTSRREREKEENIMTSTGTFDGAWMVLWIAIWWALGLIAIVLVRVLPHFSLRKCAHITPTSSEGAPPEHQQPVC